jgi:hypothetical protein
VAAPTFFLAAATGFLAVATEAVALAGAFLRAGLPIVLFCFFTVREAGRAAAAFLAAGLAARAGFAVFRADLLPRDFAAAGLRAFFAALAVRRAGVGALRAVFLADAPDFLAGRAPFFLAMAVPFGSLTVNR